jgi:hypothetical protein
MKVYRTSVVVSLLALVALAGIGVVRRERPRPSAPDCECQLLRGLAGDADFGPVYFVRENPRGCDGAVASHGVWIADHPISPDELLTLPHLPACAGDWKGVVWVKRYTAGMDTELAGWGEMGQRAGELAVFGDPLWADKVLRAAAR